LKSSLKTQAWDKGKSLRNEGRKKIGGSTEKSVVAKGKLDQILEALSIQMAEVAGLIMPPPPP
jgi:hypothetical protein